MKVDGEYLHAHAEWHDTAKISAYFSANSENKKTTATQGDGSCCEDFGTCLVACLSCKCFLDCCPRLKCWLTCWMSCFQACCPCWKDCTACLKDCCFGTYKTVEVDDTLESAEAAGRASTELNFERFIQQYEEASKVYKASTGLAMDSKDPEATLECMMKTSTLSRKLHTMHMIYRSPGTRKACPVLPGISHLATGSIRFQPLSFAAAPLDIEPLGAGVPVPELVAFL